MDEQRGRRHGSRVRPRQSPPETAGAWVWYPPDEVVAAVTIAPVPSIPLAVGDGVLTPVRDGEGRLVDWHADIALLIARGGLSEYWDWRRSWERRWPLGSVAELAALRDIATTVGHGERGVLHDVVGRMSAEPPEDQVDLDEVAAERLVHELDDLREVVAVVGGDAVVIVDETPRERPREGFARAWSPPAAETRLTANISTQVLLTPAGTISVVNAGPAGGRCDEVSNVELTGEEVVVRSRDGQELRLAGEEARPLAWIVPNSVRWRVARAPLAVVWAGCFAGLPAAVEAARRAGQPVRLVRSVPLR